MLHLCIFWEHTLRISMRSTLKRNKFVSSPPTCEGPPPAHPIRIHVGVQVGNRSWAGRRCGVGRMAQPFVTGLVSIDLVAQTGQEIGLRTSPARPQPGSPVTSATPLTFLPAHVADCSHNLWSVSRLKLRLTTASSVGTGIKRYALKVSSG